MNIPTVNQLIKMYGWDHDYAKIWRELQVSREIIRELRRNNALDTRSNL